ncbi:sigma-54-dependent Fis family transcriptional regulator [Sporomusa acidovorans]|uniref:Acetoin dehydrogenase operon transcriptional activator AcoR n=1 Tax=Sporomusa acidovorans (strain ATCC 49682 / DSM 3132 / Mol) TaxID=1123286 RepID=A0ABZ3J1T4_SPOA4|nr:sigma 54-interacting transcriptional regulator [Sporomusa acidovorans]OZC23232.1 acetoin dehydrogenase operon transcriptional activator AcoR [Sporomusa acidovorans DSM 3132]SDE98228.1 Transcriptional regulator of acetoin/glycerol metabolism [Sporomusa acidovorans]
MQPLEHLLSPIINNLNNASNQLEDERILIEKIKRQKMDMIQKKITPFQVDLVRPEIAESWKRSSENGLDPLVYNDPPLMDALSFEQRLKEKDYLIQAAAPYVSKLENMLSHIEAYIFLSDENGLILRVAQALDNNRFRLTPGTIWTEETIGTCAHELCIRLNSPIQLCGPEHFCRIFNNISSSSAPIFDVDGNLEGTLTIASPKFHRHDSYSLGLAVIMAETIQKEFQLSANRELLQSALTATEDAMIMIKAGVVIKANKAACQIFKNLEQDLIGSQIGDVFEDIPLLESVLGTREPHINTHIKIKRSKQKFSGSIQPMKSYDNKNLGCLLTLKPINSTLKVSQSSNGFTSRFTFENMIGTSPQSAKLKNLAKKFARHKSNILIQGESGTGKEVFAQAIHNESRPDGPFIAVNCAAIPKNLIESELFGYEPGAFTGAERIGKPGKIEQACGGTLFLDEIGDMPLELQAVLLRVLEDKMIMRLGGSRYISVNFRLVTATNKNLLELVKRDLFREDLYYRISVFKLNISPLRERGSDIVQLIDHFITAYAEAECIDKPTLSSTAKYILLQYNWPGNVRQLSNAISYAVCMSTDGVIYPEHLPDEILKTSSTPVLERHVSEKDVEDIESSSDSDAFAVNISVKEMEKEAIKRALEKADNHVRDAAKIVGLSKSTLYRKIKQYGLDNNIEE